MIPNLSPIFPDLLRDHVGLTGIWLDMDGDDRQRVGSVSPWMTRSMCFTVSNVALPTARRAGGGLARAYRAGRAVVTTTIILSPVLILVWSDFVPTRNFGLPDHRRPDLALVSTCFSPLITFYGPTAARWRYRFRRLPHRRTSGAEDTDAASAGGRRNPLTAERTGTGEDTVRQDGRRCGPGTRVAGRW